MIYIIVLLLFWAVISYFLIFRGFALATVWFVEGGWYRFIDGYELFWSKVREPILLVVGVLCAGFFVFSAIVGFLAYKREVKDG